MGLDQIVEELGSDQRRVAGQDEHVRCASLERGAGAPNCVAGPERRLLHGDLDVAERVGSRGRRDHDEGVDARRRRGLEDPVHHPAPEERVQVLRHARVHARAEACGHNDCCELRLVHVSG